MLNLVFFDYPFIHIDRFCITLSSFFIMLFFLLSNGAHWYFWEKKYPKKGLSILWSEAKFIWKPKLFLLLGEYMFCFFLYWLQTFTGNPKNTVSIITLAEDYLRYESLIYLLLLFFSLGTFSFHHGKERYLCMFDRVADVCFVISAACLQINRMVPVIWSIFSIIPLFVFSLSLRLWDSIAPSESMSILNIENIHSAGNSSVLTFSPQQTYGQLFESRQKAANQLKKLIVNTDSSAVSICISGEWGIGKTSLINGTTILQDDKQFSHSKLEERVEILFDRIQEEFTSPLTEEQLTTLHCFLTVCYEKMHIDPIKYRNILISYANNSSV